MKRNMKEKYMILKIKIIDYLLIMFTSKTNIRTKDKNNGQSWPNLGQ